MRRSWITTFAAILLALLLLGFLAERSLKTTTQEVSPLGFIQAIKANELRRVWVLETQLIGERRDGGILRTTKESGVTLWEMLRDQDGLAAAKDLEIKVQSVSWRELGFGLLINIMPIIVIAWLFWRVFAQAQRGAGQIFSFAKSGVKVYSPQRDPIGFGDVAGLKEAKEELREVVEFLRTPERFVRLGAQIPRGVLLIGPAGTGKTLLARAVAGEASVPFFYISGSEFVELFVGVGSARVRDLFVTAKKSAPAIIFIDEIDAVGRMRGAGIGGGHDEREQTLNQILVELDGFDQETRVILLAATNRPDVLDPALLRPGRFDRRVTLDLPDIREREEILLLHLKGKQVGRVNVKQVALRTPGFSGADLANLCNEAAILATRENKTALTQAELLNAIDKVLLGPERRSRIISKQQKEVAAYHEAGHAVVAHALPHASLVQKISIIARGRAGGYTLKLPAEEKSFHFKREFRDELAVLLAGYAAEQRRFDDVSTGASNDLQVATELARQLVTRFGMSETLGPVSLGRARELVFLGREIAVEKDYSERTAEKIDVEVRLLLQEGLDRARRALEAKSSAWERVAQALLRYEVLEQARFFRLMAEPKGSLSV